MAMHLEITRDWKGERTIGPVVVSARWRGSSLAVEFNAPFCGDAPPAFAPGPLDRLWEHEVVEVFFAGDNGRYVEVECGPFGHWLCLAFDRVRDPFACPILEVQPPVIAGARWSAQLQIPGDLLPDPITRANACWIHGEQPRVFACSSPLPGPEPDFHQPGAFARVTPVEPRTAR